MLPARRLTFFLLECNMPKNDSFILEELSKLGYAIEAPAWILKHNVKVTELLNAHVKYADIAAELARLEGWPGDTDDDEDDLDLLLNPGPEDDDSEIDDVG